MRAWATLDQTNVRSPELAGRLSGRGRAGRCPTRKSCAGEGMRVGRASPRLSNPTHGLR